MAELDNDKVYSAYARKVILGELPFKDVPDDKKTEVRSLLLSYGFIDELGEEEDEQ